MSTLVLIRRNRCRSEAMLIRGIQWVAVVGRTRACARCWAYGAKDNHGYPYKAQKGPCEGVAVRVWVKAPGSGARSL